MNGVLKQSMEWLFSLTGRQTEIRTELRAGLTTFLAMSYIVVVNPHIMATAGIDHDAAFFATCVTAAVASIIAGLFTNMPIALAPGMGLNAYFTYTVVKSLGIPWQVALGAVFLSGSLFLILAISGFVGWLGKIPQPLKRGIMVGIGLFVALIGVKEMGVVVSDPDSLLKLGHLGDKRTLLACFGFLVMAGLAARRVPAAILIGIGAAWVLGIPLGIAEWPSFPFSRPPSVSPTFWQLNLRQAWSSPVSVSVLLTFFLVVVLDNVGTITTVSKAAGVLTATGKVPREGLAGSIDGLAAMLSAVLGTSTTLSYLESLTGVEAGGRTGLTAITVGVLFAATLFVAPLVMVVPEYATAPALLLASCQMMQVMREEPWDDRTDFVPAVVIAVLIPFTLSIVTGIGLGFGVFAIMKLCSGKVRDVPDVVWAILILWLVNLFAPLIQ